MTPSILITGLGLWTPFGADLEELARAVARGEPASDLRLPAAARIDEHTQSSVRSLADAYTPPILSASHAALAHAEASAGDVAADRTGALLAAGGGRLAVEVDICKMIHDHGPRRVGARAVTGGDYTPITIMAERVGIEAVIGVHCSGPCAGLQAVGDAALHLADRAADRVLVTGAWLLDETWMALAPEGRSCPGSYPGGEAACTLVLEHEAITRARGGPLRARLLGRASGSFHTADADAAASYAATIRRALHRSGLGPDQLGAIYLHEDGGALDAIERQGLRQALGELADQVPRRSVRRVAGDAQAASTLVALALAVHEIERTKLALVVSLGPDGSTAAQIVGAVEASP
ncbi:MAG: hypothetical protein R6X02_08235 [Enhygromyxa sp.]